MANIKGRNTSPEKLVRSCLRKLKIKFRGNVRKLPGTPDIVIQGQKKIIFINGCFWHGHKGCKRATRPKTNKLFWNKKIDGNIARDKRIFRELKKTNWNIYVIWQCQIQDEKRLEAKLLRFIKK